MTGGSEDYNKMLDNCMKGLENAITRKDGPLKI